MLTPMRALILLIILFAATFWALKAHAGASYVCGGPFDRSCEDVRREIAAKRAAMRRRAAARENLRSKRKRRRRAQVRGWHREETDKVSCKDKLTVIGDSRPTKDGAIGDAEAAWMRATRWKYGESWIEIGNARGYEIRCNRASITEIVGAVMQRCELRAQPCRPPFESK